MLSLRKWRKFAQQTQTYKTQMERAQIYFRHKLLRKGLQILKENYALQNTTDSMYETVIDFNIECTRKYALRVWLQFSLVLNVKIIIYFCEYL